MRPLRSVATALAVALAMLAILAAPAAAHERRTVGAYTFVVGWLNEPAHVGQLNALDLRVTETATGKGVEGLEKTLSAEIRTGGRADGHALTLEARFGQPGAYKGEVVPTRTGDYRFHITGTIGSQRVDETFESGPGRFEGVEEITSLEYPVPADAAVAARLDELGTRVSIAIGLAALALLASIASLVRSRR
jgi:hypothetical protein